MQNLNEFQSRACIETRYHGCTNYKPSRVSARRADKRAGDRTIYISWDHSMNTLENHATAAIEFCKREGIEYTFSPLVASNDQSYFFILDKHIPQV